MSRGPNSRWALSAKYSYDTLEEAMEYARAKSGRAAVSDEVDGNNEGAEGANDTDGTAMASGKVTVKKVIDFAQCGPQMISGCVVLHSLRLKGARIVLWSKHIDQRHLY